MCCEIKDNVNIYYNIYNYSPRFCLSFSVCLQFWHYIGHIYEKHGVHLQSETKHHIIYESSPSAHQCLPCNESIITKR